ncbi:hypothetical protein FRB90_010201 [Tulasnella sp. 427]|nr:hypothetical protein FRB90_010201 [Tulasnella sp. 427]
MKFLALSLTSLALLPTFIAAAALPNVASNDNGLTKRAGEVNYLVNCIHTNYKVSHVAWYSNLDNSQGGQFPDATSDQYRDWSKNGDYLTWEGQQQTIHFSDSDANLQTHIDGDAQKRGFQQWAGWAQRSSDAKVFNCYKDNGRQLFSAGIAPENGVPQTLTCQAIYYCV